MSIPLRVLAVVRSLANFLLDPVDVERVAEPSLADAEFELRNGSARDFRAALLGFLVASCIAFFSRRLRVLSERRWPGIVPIVIASSVGAFALTRGDRPEVAGVHVLFLALGVWVAATLGTCRAESLRRAAIPLGALSAASLVATSLLGEESDGAARWVALGPLMVHVSVLVWPWVVAGIAEALSQGRIRSALAIGMTAQLGLVMQRDPSTLVVFTLAMLVAALAAGRTRASWAFVVSGLLASSGAWLTRVELESVRDVDAAWELAHALGPLAVFIGIVASVLAAIAPFRALRQATETHALAFGLGAATALACFCLRPLVAQHDAVFFLGHSGSPIVGALIACGIVSAWTPQRDDAAVSTSS